MTFPAGFVWGAAAAAYQIEGAAREEGKGLSVWDDFCRLPGKVANGDTGETACDHYHRHAEDVGLMKKIGLHAYRLSISWSRILPEGTGTVNEQGLAFYDRLIDDLQKAGITPWVTLFHWDYPLALYHRGGWLNRRSPDWFAEYTARVVDRLSDRVSHWMTLNEPQCFIEFGHGTGINAPGLCLGMPDRLRIAHHALMAHGRCVQVIRERAKTPPRIGWAPVAVSSFPADPDRPEDVDAARTHMMSIREEGLFNNTWFSDPVCRGTYPEDGLKRFGGRMPEGFEKDLALIRQSIDFYGVNIYFGSAVSAAPDGTPMELAPPIGAPRTLMGWPVTPEALRWGPAFLHERYGLPVVVTENGISNMDRVSDDGCVHDPQRIDYTRRHLLELEKALKGGADVQGYFHWSILDNFEWGHGYRQRFGLIHVDYATGTRTPKDSASWYAEAIRSNGASLH